MIITLDLFSCFFFTIKYYQRRRIKLYYLIHSFLPSVGYCFILLVKERNTYFRSRNVLISAKVHAFGYFKSAKVLHIFQNAKDFSP